MSIKIYYRKKIYHAKTFIFCVIIVLCGIVVSTLSDVLLSLTLLHCFMLFLVVFNIVITSLWDERELISMLFVYFRVFVCLSFRYCLFLLVSWVGSGLRLWLSLDFSIGLLLFKQTCNEHDYIL